jgi:hypothetical protein
MGEHAPSGTKQRINACRKRLRRGRAMQRTLPVSQDEAASETSEPLKLVSGETDFSDSEHVFEEARESPLGATRRFTSEVDRRIRLRAR